MTVTKSPVTKAPTTTKRPFRITEYKKGTPVPHRCYMYKDRAQIGALILTKYLPVGKTLEVWNIDNGKLVGQYTRKINGINIYKES